METENKTTELQKMIAENETPSGGKYEGFKEFLKDPKTSAVRNSMNRLIENSYKYFSEQPYKRLIQGHKSEITFVKYDHSSKLLMSSDDMGGLLVWDIAKKLPSRVFESGSKIHN
mmetsp:Transcript_19620/g.22306  ORF Transcript_19620/g.22306 Transcript_19620/m.22306 type:complete len:115 (+) Transcript_19620:197-541(+)